MKKKACFFVNTQDKDLINRVDFYKIDTEILRDLGFDIEFCFSFKKIPKDVDLYFIWWWTYAIFPVIYSKIFNRKSIITGTFNLERHIKGTDFFSRPIYQRFLIKKAYSLADANIMVSKFEYEKITKLFPAKRTFYSPHVLHLEKYSPKKLETNENVVFTISWMNKTNAQRKCIPQIIEAASLLKKENFPIKFYIAGKMENDANFLKDMVIDYGISDVVKFIGVISDDEKIQLFKQAKIYLQPTKFEGFGLAIVEALLSGLPVVTSPVGAVPEVTGGFVKYVSGDAPGQIASAIKEILKNYDNYKKIANSGREHVLKNFPYERRKKDIEMILQEIGLM